MQNQPYHDKRSPLQKAMDAALGVGGDTSTTTKAGKANPAHLGFLHQQRLKLAELILRFLDTPWCEQDADDIRRRWKSLIVNQLHVDKWWAICLLLEAVAKATRTKKIPELATGTVFFGGWGGPPPPNWNEAIPDMPDDLLRLVEGYGVNRNLDEIINHIYKLEHTIFAFRPNADDSKAGWKKFFCFFNAYRQLPKEFFIRFNVHRLYVLTKASTPPALG